MTCSEGPSGERVGEENPGERGRGANAAGREDGAAGRPVRSRRGVLAAAAAGLLGATAGCVTTELSVQVDGVDASSVFESVSPGESWATSRANVSVSLTDRATRQAGVRELTVVSESGSSYWSGSVSPGQTSVSHVLVPVGDRARLVAANYSGEYVGEVGLRVTGSSFP